MTITSTTTKVVCLGNGIQSVFDYDFLIPTADAVEVVYTDSDGVNTTIPASGYTITGINDEDGGTVTYLLSGSPIASGTSLTIARSLPLEQSISISNQGNFYPQAVEDALDYLMMCIQQVNEIFSRAIVAPIEDPDELLPLPPVEQRALQLLGFDADGQPIAAEPSSAIVSSAMQPVVAAASLASGRTAFGLGAMAVEGIGAGLEDNGSGSVRTIDLLTGLAISTAITSAYHMKEIVATGPITLTLPRANTLFASFEFAVNAFAAAVTVAVNVNDTVKGSTAGTSFVIPANWRATFKTDAAASGVWYITAMPITVPVQRRLPITPGGRLTFTSGEPVMTTDVTAGTIVYYTQYTSRAINIYDGTSWIPSYLNAEMAQALSDSTKSPAAAAINSNYDMFIWEDAGTGWRCTRGPAWTSDTARGTGAGTTELVRQDGAYVNTVAITNGPGALKGFYVGTIRTDASGNVVWIANPAAAAGGGNCKLYCWNMYNRVNVAAISKDSTDTWNYSTTTWRAANNSNSNRISAVFGLNEDAVSATYRAYLLGNGAGVSGLIGIGLNATNAFSSLSAPGQGAANSAGSFLLVSVTASFEGLMGLGHNYIQSVEYGTGATISWYGDNGAPTVTQMALQAKARM